METDIIKFAIAFPLLLYAAYSDIKKREADNWIWIFIGVAGAFFLFFNKNYFLEAISIAISIPIAFLLYIFGMGGADAKAIMAIALLNPLPPSITIFHSPQFVFPLTVLINSLLLILPMPIIFLIYNAIRRDIEMPYAFFGYRMEASVAKNKFVWPMEKDGRKTIFPVKNADFDSYKGRIWVTPKLPFLLFILIGYVISCLFGDILFAFVSFFLQ
ncbi:MAG: hypothetical protein FE044_02480 [Thermoplasmata archaeon]|nr:MAG: hypothetical protein FE044_02480 [Thermoplasmata archaeon]